MMAKIKSGMRKYPRGTRVAVAVSTFAAASVTILGAQALWQKAADKVSSHFLAEADSMPGADNWEKKRERAEVHQGVRTAKTMVMAGVATSLGVAWLASGVAADKVMTQLYDEEMRKPEEERDAEFVKNMEENHGLLLEKRTRKG